MFLGLRTAAPLELLRLAAFGSEYRGEKSAMHSLVVTHCGAITEFLETATHTPQLSGIESQNYPS